MFSSYRVYRIIKWRYNANTSTWSHTNKQSHINTFMQSHKHIHAKGISHCLKSGLGK